MPYLTSTQTGLAAAQLGRRKVLGQGRSEGAAPGTGTEHLEPDRSIPHMRRQAPARLVMLMVAHLSPRLTPPQPHRTVSDH